MFTCYFTMKLTYYDQITICLHSPPLGIFNLMRLVQVECASNFHCKESVSSIDSGKTTCIEQIH